MSDEKKHILRPDSERPVGILQSWCGIEAERFASPPRNSDCEECKTAMQGFLQNRWNESVRDELATAVLPGVLVHYDTTDEGLKKAADAAYRCADFMIKRRNRK